MKWLKQLWFEFKYWRAPLIISIDPAWADGDYTAEVYAKQVDGIIYIQDVKVYK